MAHSAAPLLPPARESRRLRALYDYDILDTPREAVFDDIVRLASLFCDTPIAVVNLIDAERQWFKAEVGLGVRETPLETSICAHAILEHDLLVVPDTLHDARFRENPLVTGEPGLRFYAGALLKSTDGMPLGTVCVLDTKPRELRPEQVDGLRRLSRQVMQQLEMRRMLRDARLREARLTGLIAAAGHDTKAPLRAANWALEQVKRLHPESEEKTARGTEALLVVERQLNQLVAVATTGAQLHSGVETELGGVLSVLSSIWQSEAKRRGITLNVPSTTARVRGAEALVETLIGNLLSNAVKYTAQGGSVSVEVTTEDDRVAVTVVDTGAGIPANRRDTIFDAFEQVDPDADGLGLGLWIVCQIASSLDASVSVDSREGQGSRFTVVLRRALDT